MDHGEADRLCAAVLDELESVVIADHRFLETLVTAVVSGGHVLMEDVPGTGKTLTARSLARALNLEFNRVQFTPDLLPADITGTHVYDEGDGGFEFREGPIFTNVVLADEINRAPPKTQAALLEAMSERQVSVGDETRDLPEPFMVVATQNPVEQEGTFELPEAQRDRFVMKTAMGYPERAGELELLARRGDREGSVPEAQPVSDREQVLDLQAVPERVRVDEVVREYVVDVCRATRADDRVEVGVSPRGIQRLYEASRAAATVAGREFVAPDDVHAILHQTLEHRLVLTTEASVRDVSKADVVEDAADAVPVPAMDDL
jgi:MoxR-like ATPase